MASYQVRGVRVVVKVLTDEASKVVVLCATLLLLFRLYNY